MIAVWQKIRPVVTLLLARLVECRDRLGRTSGGRHTLQRLIPATEHDDAITIPRSGRVVLCGRIAEGLGWPSRDLDFLSLPELKNPTNRLSGDQNGGK
jgi:hypothetical protein